MNLDALTATCKHLHLERDDTVIKLRNQKHAAHTMCYRLRVKLRKLELSHRLLIAIYIATDYHNQILQEQIKQAAQRELTDLGELRV